MNVGDKVYKLGKMNIKTSERKYCLYQFTLNPNNYKGEVWMKTLFDIKELMDNGHTTLIDSSTITSDKFNKQLRMVWYPLVLSFIIYRKTIAC